MLVGSPFREHHGLVMKPKNNVGEVNLARHGKRGWHAVSTEAPRLGRGSATVEPLRSREAITQIKAAIADRPRDLALFVLGIHFGLRGTDLLGLRWYNLMGPDKKIRQVVEVTEQKTGNVRRIAVSETVRRCLLVWQRESGDGTEAFVFPNQSKTAMTIQRLHQLVNEWARLAKVDGHFGSHTLRKTYGHFLYKQGTDICLLMKMFGHSSQAITLRYIGIEQRAIDEANLSLAL